MIQITVKRPNWEFETTFDTFDELIIWFSKEKLIWPDAVITNITRV